MAWYLRKNSNRNTNFSLQQALNGNWKLMMFYFSPLMRRWNLYIKLLIWLWSEHKHRELWFTSFWFIVRLPHRPSPCLPPQRDIHTMSRGTTLFSCGTVGELMPFVFFCFSTILCFIFFAVNDKFTALYERSYCFSSDDISTVDCPF